ncbi:MAG: hypothetical protein GY816_15315 [Cytophagales bacterium]|nr:hypothetical protein [Cytophagales bacterium]
MEFGDIASVSGKGGLFKVIKPTRTGAILEALDETKKKLVTSMHTKVSVLSDVSIFTTDGDGAVPLQDVMQTIKKEFAEGTGLDKNSDPEELKSFLKHVLPKYDEDKVYLSDIKKLVSWYNQLSDIAPELLKSSKEKKKEDDKKENKPAIPSANKKTQKAAPIKTAPKHSPSAKTMNRKTQ